ncbi:xylulokinase [Phaeobacter sp. 22II1-1F12B]|uniref:xylulokinase n=1 Tax=Phaeobacter sp. 22II1-1F12B TaxID=1317111 RepID=UPI000B523A44|nr:xylulokinase [Phaeobacter sp. 22II1-1F12B]OWU80696.1 xylulose kinase [Phaeobacter sp. 22II1-1F12B]
MFVGLDLGTSGVRALLVDADGAAVAVADAGLSVSHPHPGWSEQDPADWIAASEQALASLVEQAPDAMAQLRGIGLSGQMHGATLLDAEGAVLRPCMLWNDTRSHAQAAKLDANPDFPKISGNIVFPGFTAPKVMWVAENEPEIFAQVAKVLLPKDYLSYWLTGRAASDMSDSAGTSWMDVGARAWSENLLKGSGMRADQMPDLIEGTDIVGTIRPELAKALGLPADVQVVAGGGDNAASACGVGALGEGDGFVSLGTSGVLLAARDGFAPSPESAVHTFCHAIPGTWYQMGVILAATDCLNWLASVTGVKPAELTAELGETITEPGAVRFLPYLSGERTPHNDSAVRGSFINLSIGTKRSDLARAVLEGVSFALRDNLEALKSTGARLDRVLAIGGGAQSRYWIELLATVLNMPVDLPERGEFGAALGAARLAICGITGAAPETVMTKPPVSQTIEPRADLQGAYEAAYQAFAQSYPTLKAMP